MNLKSQDPDYGNLTPTHRASPIRGAESADVPRFGPSVLKGGHSFRNLDSLPVDFRQVVAEADAKENPTFEHVFEGFATPILCATGRPDSGTVRNECADVSGVFQRLVFGLRHCYFHVLADQSDCTCSVNQSNVFGARDLQCRSVLYWL